MPLVVQASSAADIAAVAALFRAYAASLPVDLGYQGFEAELAGLPGAYAPPAGVLLLARGAAGAALGCVALRPMPTPGHAEVKRLYVAPEGRGQGLGRALLDAATSAARLRGYRALRLDTLPFMTEAMALYRRAGFREVSAFNESPVPGTRWYALEL